MVSILFGHKLHAPRPTTTINPNLPHASSSHLIVHFYRKRWIICNLSMGKGESIEEWFHLPQTYLFNLFEGTTSFWETLWNLMISKTVKGGSLGREELFFTLFINNWLIFLRGGIVQKFKISDIFTFNCEKWNFLSLAVFYDLIKYRDLSNILLNYFQDTAVA